MKTIDCLLKVSDTHTSPRRGVTPAEVMVLRFKHDKSAGGVCITSPVDTGAALMAEPSQEEDGEPTYRPRTDQEEYIRLRSKYQGRKKGTNDSFMDDLFPGSQNGDYKFPAEFSEIPPKYRLTEEIKPYVAPSDVPVVVEATPMSGAQVSEANDAKEPKAKKVRKPKE